MTGINPSRRKFLVSASALAAGTVLTTRSAFGEGHSSHRLPNNVATSPHGAATFLHSPMPASTMRTLASTAIEAARAAGASYADVRVAELQTLSIAQFIDPEPRMSISTQYGYGLRVLVDGAWNFVHGTIPSVDAMARSARQAVATTRAYTALVKRPVTFVPTPAVTGEWTMPIQLDPFEVPLQDHAALMEAYAAAVARNRYVSFTRSVSWFRETRVVATSEGSSIAQQRWRCDPRFMLLADYGMGGLFMVAPGLHAASAGGYERFAIPGHADVLAAAADASARIAALPRGVMDVGRYPVTLDGMSTAAVFTRTVSPALELDRVLGTEADASGTSYLGPVNDMLGAPIASPSISVMAHRSMPSVSAVKWDDEGVEVQPYPIIERGRLMDYHTSRETAVVLTEPYQQRHQSVRSHGCAVAPLATDPVSVRMPHTSITSAPGRKSLDDLCRDMGKGVLVRDMYAFDCDPSLASGFINSRGATLLEVAGGVPVRRIEANGVVFQSKKFWNNVVALGDATTVQPLGDNTFGGGIPKGMPWRAAPVSGSAPAALIKEINVVGIR